MNWSTKKSLKSQVEKYWERGTLLASLLSDQPFFPKRLIFKTPTSKELLEQFDAVRRWIKEISTTTHIRLEHRLINHRLLGSNEVPKEAWIESLDEAVKLLGKAREFEQFSTVVKTTRQTMPALLSWIEENPMKALNECLNWQRYIDIINWFTYHPRPDIYSRQIDIEGIDSKFVESNRAMISQLLNHILPQEHIDDRFRGSAQFESRFGLKTKPTRIRFRLLDDSLALLPGSDQDITLTAEDFARLNSRTDFQNNLQYIFITENEINFLSFPKHPNSIVIFGSGYGFKHFEHIEWLNTKEVYYWGDIDTHGFAILDQLRAWLPHARSMLMDEETLLTHRDHWSCETSPASRCLSRLSFEEKRLYQQLCDHSIDDKIRLEQERIPYHKLERFLQLL
ncbi:MAG: Wadjet anti-phage system protein JetD domain-containing protein [Francisellaceae bacterium]